MRDMTKRLISILIATTLLVSHALTAESPFTAAFEGTGRACYGALYIRTKTISWLTSFSQCQKAPYEVIERSEKGNQRQFVFRLKQRSKSCLYEVLYLYHEDKPDPDIHWHVISYGSVESYQVGKRNEFKELPRDALACYLVIR